VKQKAEKLEKLAKESEQSYEKASTSSLATIHGTVRTAKPQRGKFDHLFDSQNFIKEENNNNFNIKKLKLSSDKKKDSELMKSPDKKSPKPTSTNTVAATTTATASATTSATTPAASDPNNKEKWKCSVCTVPNEGGTKCLMCGNPKGTPQIEDTLVISRPTTNWTCPKCKVENKAEYKNCSMCGTLVPQSEDEPETRMMRSKSAGSVKKRFLPKLDDKKS